MTPYYADDAITIYNGDSREVSPQLAFDLIVTDPPYGTSWRQDSYLTVGRSPNQRTTRHRGIANDRDASARDFILNRFSEVPACVFGSPLVDPPTGVRAVLVWRKPRDAGLFGTTTPWRRDWEAIYILGMWPGTGTRSSVIQSALTGSSEYAKGVHPHAKPVDVMAQLIECSPPGVLLDPFMGSGSTLVAAKQLGRKAIGIEIDEAHCEVAANRCSQEVLGLAV